MEIFIDDYVDPFSRKVAIVLLNHVIKNINGDFTIRYGTLSKLTGNVVGPRQIGEYLGVISDCCDDNGLPLLSAAVVNEGGMPGNGFFDYFYPGVSSSLESQIRIINKEFAGIKAHKKDWEAMLEAFMKYESASK